VSVMIRVRAPSRLHFGLLSFPVEASCPDPLDPVAVPARHFGGVGLMVQAPGMRITVRPASAWSAEGPLAGRALDYARRFAQAVLPASGPPQHLLIEHCPPSHAGLGTGTQLALAVGRAMTAAWGLPGFDEVELARRLGRGRRSALGIHGFAQGGFLVEAGKHDMDTIAPLVAHRPFPEDWRLVLVLPRHDQGLHGRDEAQAFQHLHGQGTALARTDTLCRLVLLGMLPALAERDGQTFGEALYEFNCLVGEAFAAVQGGVYASPRTAEWVTFIRQQRIRGVGQSSWGPAVFAVTADEAQAHDLMSRLQHRFALDPAELVSTPPCNTGAALDVLDEFVGGESDQQRAGEEGLGP
jgi:beta-ribofuranosylaminobenzene 5'-phosphate synthase